MRRIVIMSIAGLLSLGLVACSSSESAEKEESGTEKAAQAQKKTEEEPTEETKAAESEGVDKKQMHQLHKRLVQSYVDTSDKYKKRAEETDDEKLKKMYASLIERHDEIAAKYGHGKNGENGKKSEKGMKGKKGKKGHHAKKHKKHHGPKHAHVAKMAKHQEMTAKLHQKVAVKEKEAGNSDLYKHHDSMASDYEKLAKMHGEFAAQLKANSGSKPKNGKKGENGEKDEGSKMKEGAESGAEEKGSSEKTE